MSKYNKTILTNAGLDLAAKASSGKAKFTITRAATSTEKLADKSISELQQLTALPSLMQYGEINNVADSAQDKSIVIGAVLVFNNKDLTTGYNVNTIGLFAKEEGVNKEILYALTTAIEPEMMPDFKDKVLFKFNLTMFVVVGQTDNVSVNVTENGMVTQEQLAKAVQALPQKQDITNIKNAIDQIDNQIKALGKVKKVQGKEPDADGNIDITFGKIIKGWDMVNNTFDPSQTKNNDSISNIWPVDQIVIAQVVSKLLSTETSLKSEIAKKDNTTDVNNKLSTIRSTIHTIANPILEDNKTNPDSLTESGIYFSKNGFNFAKNDIPDGYRSDGKTYIFVLEGENPGYSLNYYQQFMFQATKFNFECWYRAGYKYGSDAYYTVSFVNMKDVFGKFKQISLNGGTPISPDEDGVAKLNVVTKVDNTSPDSNGNVNTDHYTKAESDKRHNDLISRIQIQENKEIVHQCDDLDSGVAYSKAHPNVFVATP